MRKRCFIGFFGITRGLQWTIESIEKRIFAPVAKAGLDQVRVAHFNLPHRLNAPRSGETDVPFALGDIGRLGLQAHVIEPQLESSIAPELDHVLRIPQKGEPDADGSVRRNALFQMHSLRGLGRIFAEMEPHSFDMVLLLRPDLRYLDRLPIQQLLSQLRGNDTAAPHRLEQMIDLLHRRWQPKADLVLPAWHKWGGLNDRFAICTPEAAMVYMNRISRVHDYCRRYPYFQTEHLLAFVIGEAGLRTADTWVRAERVRTDGRVDAKDYFPIKERAKWFLGWRPLGVQSTQTG